MQVSASLTKRLLENLTTQISFAQFKPMVAHWNSKYEAPTFHRFYLMERGEGSITVNGQLYYPQPGQLVMLPAGTKQSRWHQENNPYHRYICHFTAYSGSWPLFHGAETPLIADVDEAAFSFFQDLIFSFQASGAFSVLRSQACLLQLLAICLEKSGEEVFIQSLVQSEERKKLVNVLDYIDEHLHTSIEIEDLAKQIHLHPNYFIPYFKKHIGVTPMHYVKQKRIEEAKKLLSYTDRSIGEIADRFGWELPQFSNIFKHYTGLSPSSFRQSNR